MKKKQSINGIRNGRKDVFYEFMVEGAEFDGKWEIPIIPDNVYSLPKELVGYDQRKSKKILKNLTDDAFIHFFIDDYKFDGPNGIWNGSRKNFNQKRGFSIESMKKYSGIIGPDFTIGYGFPLSTQLDNVRRKRYFEFWMTKLGFQVIPSVRWTDERSYEFAFLGLSYRGIVAVGTYGSMKNKFLRESFKKGLEELVKRINPRIILVYGEMPEDVFSVVDKNLTQLINYESTTYIFRGKKNG